jgi:hypothetical protein
MKVPQSGEGTINKNLWEIKGRQMKLGITLLKREITEPTSYQP